MKGYCQAPTLEVILCRKFAVKLSVLRELCAQRKPHMETRDTVFRAGLEQHAGNKASISRVELQEENER